MSRCSLKVCESLGEAGVFVPPFPLIQPDQDDNGLIRQEELTS